ncbi:MAG: ABC transporter substrate-binding protein [Deltaproteobacteria bacterium]|nr:ABC transporter substrate-binding protein [Deltaproteobacteria bacterium]MBW2066161.1 ABC transporter substrate-binding protein [Deltaproteobacteria bacterium]
MKIAKTLIAVTFVTLLAAGGVFAADTIKIGLMAPLTGFAAADGASVHNSVKLAVERVNNEGGVLGKKVELIVYDDRADGKEAVAVARKLIQQDRVIAVVAGSYSTPSRASAPIFQDEEIPFVAAYAVHPDITKAGNYCFRNGFLGMVEGKSAGYVAVEMLKAKRIALLTTDNDFGREMAAGFKDYIKNRGKGASIVYEKTYPFKEKDYKPYLSRIKGTNADLIVVSGYYFHTAPILKQAREMGINTQVLGEEGADSPKTIEIAGKAAEGFIMVTNLNRDDPRPEVQHFLKEYESRYKIQPDMVGASAYDGFMIICEAIKRAGSTEGKAIRAAIAATKDFNALTGVIKGFNDIGEVVKEVQVQVVRGGRFHYYGVVKDISLITP